MGGTEGDMYCEWQWYQLGHMQICLRFELVHDIARVTNNFD